MQELISKEGIKKVAWIKRFMEYESLFPGFAAEVQAGGNETLKKYGIPLDVSEIGFENRDPHNPNHMDSARPGTVSDDYAEFMNHKFAMIDILRSECEPTNDTFKRWRARQIGRCNMQLGPKVVALIHAPVVFELADGCSVGCEFCGLNAGRLKSVFKYTEENAALFKDVLNICKEVVGDAAGSGTLYFASEPLDNPDYELFMKDYVDIFGRIPQITTATVLKHKEQMHKLLKALMEDRRQIYRFSVLSLEHAKEIFDEFTPEELVLVELLPQFEEAPTNNFVNAGRNADKNEEYGDTISCVSGFIINMARKQIRISTPTWACKEHPTGEYLLYTRDFTDAESFREALTEGIKTYMSNILGPKEELRVRPFIDCFTQGKEFVMNAHNGMEYRVKDEKAIEIYEAIFKIIGKEYKTREEIVKEFIKLPKYNGVRTDLIFYTINKFWSMGLLECKSGKL